jgi:hypothetical protein
MLPFKKYFYESDGKTKIIRGVIRFDDLFIDEFPEFMKDILVIGTVSASRTGFTSLRNCPRKIIGCLNLYKNKLTSLEGMPDSMSGGSIDLSHNKLTSLEYFTQNIRQPQSINLSHNKLTSLEHLNVKYVGGDFNCSHNKLTSLKGAPQRIYFDLYAQGNQINTLDGFPKEVFENLYIDQDFPFSNDEIRAYMTRCGDIYRV